MTDTRSYNVQKTRFLKSAKEKDATAEKSLYETVDSIIKEVRARGDEAVSEYSKKFDNVDLKVTKVSASEIEKALESFDEQTLKDSKFAIEQVKNFAEAQYATMQPLEIETLKGVHLGHRIIPIETVGCYVPGGRYPIYSAPIMSIVPAVVAGCKNIIACLPPSAHEQMYALCHLAGATSIYRIGGAQAIAAMAYGTETVPAVDKIVGPGNAFVNEAKRQVFGKVGIDALAGPSEIFTIADESANPIVIAADLLAQAEHDVHTRVGLAVTSEDIANKTLLEIERQLGNLSTAETAGKAWEDQGEIVICEDEESLVEFANYMATEHLQVHTKDPHALIPKLKNYGSLFIGENASVVYSDKCCGTNHTLPTMAAARYTGGLWVGSYVKTCTHQWMEEEGIRKVAPRAVRQSLTEGMEGHARAAALRLFPSEINQITSGDFPKI
ncbi:histidinol dehydrogenase [Vreelandella arcis]|uniref:Sulfopropanediol 3-dehydrogenase n=1 Tax=Vreelandella arcis TaxID=416873 RepID=A0A1H0CID3_9GAMM|nr:histidinol dehydrogenase [Halomonas arcis]SDN57636.1 sulfopropanediol 3-dehydrogenase [Halomonas arcis]